MCEAGQCESCVRLGELERANEELAGRVGELEGVLRSCLEYVPVLRHPAGFDWGDRGCCGPNHPEFSVDDSNQDDMIRWAADKEAHEAALRAKPVRDAALAVLED